MEFYKQKWILNLWRRQNVRSVIKAYKFERKMILKERTVSYVNQLALRSRSEREGQSISDSLGHRWRHSERGSPSRKIPILKFSRIKVHHWINRQLQEAWKHLI